MSESDVGKGVLGSELSVPDVDRVGFDWFLSTVMGLGADLSVLDSDKRYPYLQLELVSMWLGRLALDSGSVDMVPVFVVVSDPACKGLCP